MRSRRTTMNALVAHMAPLAAPFCCVFVCVVHLVGVARDLLFVAAPRPNPMPQSAPFARSSDAAHHWLGSWHAPDCSFSVALFRARYVVISLSGMFVCSLA